MNKLALPFIAFLFFTSNADAQPGRVVCAPREGIVARLASRFGEKQVSWALTKENTVLETFSNVTTKSWTILVTSANGSACLLASGENFNMVAEKPGEPL